MSPWAQRLPLLCLAAAVAASAALLLALDSQLTFVADDWELLVKRDGWSAADFLAPFNENIIAGPAVVYRLLLISFGMGSALPFFAVTIGLFLLSAVLLFVLLRRRVGDWPALVGAVLVLFLGAAFEDLLWAFQVGYAGSMAAGLGTLLALEREDRRGDRIACGLLLVAVAFSSLGLAFVFAAAVAIALGSRRWDERLFVPLAPLALYAVWWGGWGHSADGSIGADNLVDLPGFVFDAAAAGVTSLLGLATGDGSESDQPHLIWGRLGLLVVIGAVLWRVRRERGIPAGLAIALALGLFFWASAGLVREAERLPTSSRYQYPSAVFLLLILAEALRGVRIPWPATAAAGAVAALAVVSGTGLLHREYEERWRPTGEGLRATLAAVDIAGASAQPGYRIAFAPAPVATARAYREAVASYGSPAYSEAQLLERPEANRANADLTLAQAQGLALRPPNPATAAACERLPASPDGSAGTALPPGAFSLRNESALPAEVLLGRFSDRQPVSLGPVPAGLLTGLAIPADRSPRPWRLGLKGSGDVRLCTLGPGRA